MACQNEHKHTPCPSGVVQWQSWAAAMTAAGARQLRCADCGKWAIWTSPRKPVVHVESCLTCYGGPL